MTVAAYFCLFLASVTIGWRRHAIIISMEARPGLWVDGVDRCRVIELDACAAHAASPTVTAAISAVAAISKSSAENNAEPYGR